ncbi:MAG: acyl-CoA reductase [Chitinophagaceae bacterium]|nr:MAG: acyl-CoA reductase [Chitinophagaceae bacterium]
MNLQMRFVLLERLGEYILSNDPQWQAVIERAGQENGWFIKEFTELSSSNIANRFLKGETLKNWAASYNLENINPQLRSVGIVMAGNIPLVGFHDFLCVFICGYKARIKASSKDSALIKYLVSKMAEWNYEVNELVQFEVMLKGCDAYIATGSNNSSRYFEYYFDKYPHIIRRNKTSVAVLDGTENNEELDKLADDVHLYFGLGCRNVTKIYVPENYDFIPLLTAFKKYLHLADHHKYKNNYDYNLAIHILNNKFYMTNGSIILFENKSLFSPISQLNYEYYSRKDEAIKKLSSNQDLQCIIGHDHIAFGQAQYPAINDYADGVDTMKFLTSV